MENITQQSLSGIVLDHHEAISVFEKYHLDFCCGGKKTLEAACAEKSLPLQDVVKEIEGAARTDAAGLNFSAMTADQLISYILIHHHFYVSQSMPVIAAHIGKVAEKHGDSFTYILQVQELFQAVQGELLPHMMKEEKILFPRIKEIAAAYLEHKSTGQPSNYLDGPIAVMEMEHERAGELMAKIGEITNQYTAPESACTTHRLCLEELRAFENDLHRHVHLENNLLFPMAEKMYGKIH